MTNLVDDPNLVFIGRIGRSYGLKGWVWLRCDSNTQIFNYKELWIKLQSQSNWVLKSAFQIKKHHSKVILFFPACCSKEGAAALNGATVAIQRDALDPLPLDSYYWCDLQGLKVMNPEGKPLGRVKALIETGPNDVLVLEEEGGQTLIPFVKQFILRVDLKEGVIVADWDPEF